MGISIGVVLNIVEAALSIWKSKLRDKYIDRINSLKKRYEEEMRLPENERSQAVLDNIGIQLQLEMEALAAQIKLGDQ